jgi:hypothetical protein
MEQHIVEFAHALLVLLKTIGLALQAILGKFVVVNELIGLFF